MNICNADMFEIILVNASGTASTVFLRRCKIGFSIFISLMMEQRVKRLRLNVTAYFLPKQHLYGWPSVMISTTVGGICYMLFCV
jgi:hypothetical protein